MQELSWIPFTNPTEICINMKCLFLLISKFFVFARFYLLFVKGCTKTSITTFVVFFEFKNNPMRVYLFSAGIQFFQRISSLRREGGTLKFTGRIQQKHLACQLFQKRDHHVYFHWNIFSLALHHLFSTLKLLTLTSTCKHDSVMYMGKLQPLFHSVWDILTLYISIKNKMMKREPLLTQKKDTKLV